MDDLQVLSLTRRRTLYTTVLQIIACAVFRSTVIVPIRASSRRGRLYNAILPIIACLSLRRLATLHFWSSGKPRTPRMALLIGIRYLEQDSEQQLSTLLHDDTRTMRNILKGLGYDVTVMLDGEGVPPYFNPTKDNILREIDHLVTGALPCDQVVFVYSGHGDQERCLIPGEEIDGKDEVIIGADGGVIRDNELRKHLVQPLPVSTKLFALFDSCHSGTILDLEHNWRYNALTGRLIGPSRYPTCTVFNFLSILDLLGLLVARRPQDSPQPDVLPDVVRIRLADSVLSILNHVEICFSAAKDDC